MSTLRFDLAGKSWVAGLWWQPIEEKGSPISLGRRLAERVKQGENGFDCFCVRKDNKRQVGLGNLAEDLPAALGHKSAAAAVALAQSEQSTVAGYFALDETHVWVVAVMDGQVLPEYDVVAAPEQAQALWSDLNALGGWAHAHYRPDVLEAREQLERLLGGKGKPAELVSVKRKSRKKELMGGAVLFGVSLALVIGYQQYEAWQQRKAAEQQQAMMKARLDAKRAQAALPKPGPWLSKPPVAQALQGCLSALAETPLYQSGWQLERAICAPGSVSRFWARTSAGQFTVLPERARLDVKSPEKTRSLHPFEFKPLKRAQEQLLSREALAAELFEWARQVNGRLNLVWTPDPVALPNQKEAPPPPPWREVKWSMSLPGLGNGESWKRLRTLPGVVLDQMTIETAGGGKRVAGGKAYALR